MALGKVIKIRAWIKITSLCGEKKDTNEQANKPKQNESNNSITKQNKLTSLHFPFHCRSSFLSSFRSLIFCWTVRSWFYLSKQRQNEREYVETIVETIHVERSLSLT